MAIDSKLRRLALGLLHASRRRKLHWKKGDEEGVFFTDFNGVARVSIKEGYDSNGDVYYDITLIRPSTEVIETVMLDRTSELRIASELFLLARRNALGFDDVVDSIIENVNLLNHEPESVE